MIGVACVNRVVTPILLCAQHPTTHTAPGCWLHAKQRHTSQPLLRLYTVRTKRFSPFLASRHAALVLLVSLCLSVSLYISPFNCRRLFSPPSVLEEASHCAAFYSALDFSTLSTIVRQLGWCSDYATGYKTQGSITFPNRDVSSTNRPDCLCGQPSLLATDTAASSSTKPSDHSVPPRAPAKNNRRCTSAPPYVF